MNVQIYHHPRRAPPNKKHFAGVKTRGSGFKAFPPIKKKSPPSHRGRAIVSNSEHTKNQYISSVIM